MTSTERDTLSQPEGAKEIKEPSCPICGGGGLRPQLTHHAGAQEYTLLRCTSCGIEHWDPLTAPGGTYYSDEAQPMYAAMHEGTRRAQDDVRFARFLDQFKHARGKRLLDVGCADGVLLEAFRALGNEVVGIDIDARSLRRAKDRRLEVHESTLEQFAASGRTENVFDFITMFDVLEHLTAPMRVLALARSMLKLDGS
jgi:SAM-dependent methyltransferase